MVQGTTSPWTQVRKIGFFYHAKKYFFFSKKQNFNPQSKLRLSELKCIQDLVFLLDEVKRVCIVSKNPTQPLTLHFFYMIYFILYIYFLRQLDKSAYLSSRDQGTQSKMGVLLNLSLRPVVAVDPKFRQVNRDGSVSNAWLVALLPMVDPPNFFRFTGALLGAVIVTVAGQFLPLLLPAQFSPNILTFLLRGRKATPQGPWGKVNLCGTLTFYFLNVLFK